MHHPPGTRLFLRMPGTDQRQRQRGAEDLLCLHRHGQVSGAGAELKAAGRGAHAGSCLPSLTQADERTAPRVTKASKGLAGTVS